MIQFFHNSLHVVENTSPKGKNGFSEAIKELLKRSDEMNDAVKPEGH
jgi:hypothetical protein